MITFIVVLYQKQPIESSTLLSLEKFSSVANDSFKLIVWNNGPEGLSGDALSDLNSMFGTSVEVVETLENLPLSGVYNTALSRVESDFYCILDDDTHLTPHYLKTLAVTLRGVGGDVVVTPELVTQGRVESPKWFPINREWAGAYGGYFFAAMSGVVFSDGVRKAFEANFGSVFDERFPFYGIDNVFFYRLRKLGLLERLIVLREAPVEHRFSRHEGSQSGFRRYHRALDVANFFRFYPGVRSSIRFLMFLGRTASSGDLYSLKVLLRSTFLRKN